MCCSINGNPEPPILAFFRLADSRLAEDNTRLRINWKKRRRKNLSFHFWNYVSLQCREQVFGSVIAKVSAFGGCATHLVTVTSRDKSEMIRIERVSKNSAVFGGFNLMVADFMSNYRKEVVCYALFPSHLPFSGEIFFLVVASSAFEIIIIKALK